MMKHFYRYLVVGGMPDAVREYVETADMNSVTDVQKSIIALYLPVYMSVFVSNEMQLPVLELL